MFAGNCFASSASVERIIPSKKVSLHKNGQKVGEYTSEAPLPKGAMLQCDGDCAVKLKDLYVVATDQSVFQVMSTDKNRRLAVQEGKAYFALSDLERSMNFLTPIGMVSAQQVTLEASSTSMLKGFLAVTAKGAELAVTEGGSLTVLTADGVKTIQPGQSMQLAQATPGTAPPPPAEDARQEEDEDDTLLGWIFGLAGAALIIALIAADTGGSDPGTPIDGGGPGPGPGPEGSPFRP